MVSYSMHIPILTFAIFIQIAISTNPLYTICSNSQNFTSYSPYEKNLVALFAQLYFKTPPSGFGEESSGQYPNKAYGLSLCRGDVSVKDCVFCIVEASAEIIKRCPNDKGAIIWYDKCYLKYSNDDFLGKIDTQNTFYMWNVQNVTINPEKFIEQTYELLSKLSEEACSDADKMYASGDVEVEGMHEKIYGMVQSSRDISKVDCKKCIDDAIGQLPRGKVGGRVVGGSCNVRYEIYPFLIV